MSRAGGKTPRIFPVGGSPHVQYVIQTPYGGVDPLTSDDNPSHLTQSRPPRAGYIIHKVA